jgi:hypothetical protein
MKKQAYCAVEPVSGSIVLKVNSGRIELDAVRNEITVHGVEREACPFPWSSELIEWARERDMEYLLDMKADELMDAVFKAQLIKVLAEELS